MEVESELGKENTLCFSLLARSVIEPKHKNTTGQLMKFSQFKLRAFNSKNYRLFFFGQGTSLIGTWMNNMVVKEPKNTNCLST